MKQTLNLIVIIFCLIGLKANGQWIIGSTDTGGVGNYGTIVKIPYGYDTVQYTYNMLGGLNGYAPRSLTRACDGIIYGIADGGIGNHGIIFSFNPTTNVFTKKIDLHASGCWHPYGISWASNGKIYGSTGAPIDTSQSFFFEYNPVTNIIVKRDSTLNYFPINNVSYIDAVHFTKPFIGKNNTIYYASPSAPYNQNYNIIGPRTKLIKFNISTNVKSILDSVPEDSDYITSIIENSDSGLYVQGFYWDGLVATFEMTINYKNGWQNWDFNSTSPSPRIISPFIQHQDGKMYIGNWVGMQCYSDILIYKYNLNGFGYAPITQTIVSQPFTTSDQDAYIQVYKMPDGNIYYASNGGYGFCGNYVSRIGHLNINTNNFTQAISTNLVNSMVYSGKDFLGKDVTKTILPNQKYNLTKINQSPEITLSYKKSNWSTMTTPTQAVAGTYYLIGTSNTGCLDTLKVTVKTGAVPSLKYVNEDETVDDINTEPIIYPNPFVDILNIEMKLLTPSTLKIDILDIQGKLINSTENNYSEGANTIQISTSNLTAGIYFIKIIENGEQKSVQKIIKE